MKKSNATLEARGKLQRTAVHARATLTEEALRERSAAAAARRGARRGHVLPARREGVQAQGGGAADGGGAG
jgi:hypothetical protein